MSESLALHAPVPGEEVFYNATDANLVHAPRLILPLKIMLFDQDGRIAGWLFTVPGMKSQNPRSGLPMLLPPMVWLAGVPFDAEFRAGSWARREHLHILAIAEAEATALRDGAAS